MHQSRISLTSKPLELLQTDYENAVKALNTLQSNAEYIKQVRTRKLTHPEEFARAILETQTYLVRSGITLEMLDTLPVIHVAGTKGKGTTCALCESILRHHGFKTGFYSSPHLVEVRERIRINGVPLRREEFARHFWNTYNKLLKERTCPTDMPMYFKFLTIMAFRIFFLEQVDVAIIEVGIGGEYDSTNILRRVPVAGITSLGLDHTGILGETLEKIAWHKAGIMKQGTRVFTVSHPNHIMNILKQRSVERNCTLEVVKPLETIPSAPFNGPFETYAANASLAIALAEAWMKHTKQISINLAESENTKLGLLKCLWPGRYQVIQKYNTYYLDGAHTLESIQVCSQWFKDLTENSPNKNALIFNVTGDRDSEELMTQLRTVNFDRVYFVPNKAFSAVTEDVKNYNIVEDQQLKRCNTHLDTWNKLELIDAQVKIAEVKPSVWSALQECQSEKHDVLITGSLHLVGAALSVIESSFNENGDAT